MALLPTRALQSKWGCSSFFQEFEQLFQSLFPFPQQGSSFSDAAFVRLYPKLPHTGVLEELFLLTDNFLLIGFSELFSVLSSLSHFLFLCIKHVKINCQLRLRQCYNSVNKPWHQNHLYCHINLLNSSNRSIFDFLRYHNLFLSLKVFNGCASCPLMIANSRCRSGHWAWRPARFQKHNFSGRCCWLRKGRH